MSISRFSGCKAIFFDFGGTLDSDGEHWFDRFLTLFEEAGAGILPQEIKRAFYRADAHCCGNPEVRWMGLRPLMRRHVRLQLHGLGLEDEELEGHLVSAFCEKSERFFRRNASWLRRLRRRYRTGVVSNFYGNVDVLCEEAGLSESLHLILDSALLVFGKPDPRIFRKALRVFRLEPSQAIFVGDSFERDMMPARGIGMKTVWLKGPNPRVPAGAGPTDGCISKLTELEDILS